MRQRLGAIPRAGSAVAKADSAGAESVANRSVWLQPGDDRILNVEIRLAGQGRRQGAGRQSRAPGRQMEGQRQGAGGEQSAGNQALHQSACSINNRL